MSRTLAMVCNTYRLTSRKSPHLWISSNAQQCFAHLSPAISLFIARNRPGSPERESRFACQYECRLDKNLTIGESGQLHLRHLALDRGSLGFPSLRMLAPPTTPLDLGPILCELQGKKVSTKLSSTETITNPLP